jgi:PST family polysaccharide transporter
VVVGRVLGITALGYYDKAFQTVARFTTKINLAGPSVSFRVFALIHEERERFRRAYQKVILSVTMVSYPLMAGMAAAAPQLIEVLFGPRWLAAVAPFQILCVAAMLRMLNMYASTATQAKGQIWSEVRRQAVFVVVLVTAVYALSRWGIAGAAAGVLVATVVMTVLLQSLVRRLAGLLWRDIIGPQIPAVVCAAGLFVVVILVNAATQATIGTLPAVASLAISIAASALFYLVFLLVSPFDAVRAVVLETAQDLAPPVVAKRLTWLAPAKELPAMAGQ